MYLVFIIPVHIFVGTLFSAEVKFPRVFQGALESKREQRIYWRTGEENGEASARGGESCWGISKIFSLNGLEIIILLGLLIIASMF